MHDHDPMTGIDEEFKAFEKESDNNENKPFYTGYELLKRKTEEIPCLLGNILPQVGLCAMAGSSDTGKSSWLRQLLICVVAGLSRFLGYKLYTRNKRAILVSTEDDEYAMSWLLNKANKTFNLRPENLKSLTIIFDTFHLLERLDLMLSESPADLIVIDAFSDIYGRSMNDTNQVRTFLNEYSQLAQKHKCLIIFLHHTGKRTEELSPGKHNLLGSQGFEAKMRLVFELRKDQDEADKRHMCIVKANYLPEEYKRESFVLQFDENMTFTMTNERRSFDELRPDAKDSKEKKGIDPEDIAEETHMELLEKVYASLNLSSQDRVTYAKLWQEIKAVYNPDYPFGNNKAKEFLTYFKEQEWIKQVNSYYYLNKSV